jgi:ribosome-binding protein aMBF1 (putative translation factor)
MKKSEIQKLEKAGWKVGTAAEFLSLTDEEASLIEMKIALSRTVRERRADQSLTQEDLAKRLGSSQSRVAKIEAADATVSIDLLVRSLLALGATNREVGQVIEKSSAVPAA